MTDVELPSNTVDIGRDDTGGKCHDKTSNGDDHGAVPLVRLGPVLWVLGVIFGECH